MSVTINEYTKKLGAYIDFLEEQYGGGIQWSVPVTDAALNNLESNLDYKLPTIFRWLYTQKTNGLKIDNRAILSVYDQDNKKTFVECLDRYNNPQKDLFFKGRPNIFDDYLIVGYEHTRLICLSKKYDLPNPLLYLCPNPNHSKGVDFYGMDFDLYGFIKRAVWEILEDGEEGEWVLTY